MSSAITRGLAIICLIAMIILGATSMRNDALTNDEDPHIGAGISYITQKDMRINPEHPPLMKDLAALPLLFMKNLKVPTDDKSWTEDINGQWDFGRKFIFYSGNDANLIVFLARLAPLAIMITLGWFVFRASFELGGAGGGLIAIILYAFSPVILAHGRLVTTDVPAAAGSFIATYFLLKYFKKPDRKSLLAAGFTFGIAQLFKFSNFLLIPYFGVLAFTWIILKMIKEDYGSFKKHFKDFLTIVGGTIAVGIIGYVVVYIVYVWHVWNYPVERQMNDAKMLLSSFGSPFLANLVIAMTQIPVLRPLAQYLLGLFMVLQRATGGNTAFFMGQVASTAWQSYFPVVYLFKVPLSFHILSVLTIFIGIKNILAKMMRVPSIKAGMNWLFKIAFENFIILASLMYIGMYWLTSISSNLNIGVRHLMPVFPFTILLISLGAINWLKNDQMTSMAPLAQLLDTLKNMARMGIKLMLILPLLIWYVGGALIAWPHYIAWYNELAPLKGGGHNITVDSNLDWGQDLRYLAKFVEDNKIEKINVNYFGWAPPEYYLGDKFEPWWKEKTRPHGWFALSATYKQEGCATPAKGWRHPTDYYCLLNDYQPVAIIGNSIFVYNLP